MSKADDTPIGRYPRSPMKVIFLSPFMSKVMCDFQCCMSFAPHLCCFQEGKRNARNYLLIEILLLNAIALESKCLCVANCSPRRSYRYQESMIPLASFFFFIADLQLPTPPDTRKILYKNVQCTECTVSKLSLISFMRYRFSCERKQKEGHISYS